MGEAVRERARRQDEAQALARKMMGQFAGDEHPMVIIMALGALCGTFAKQVDQPREFVGGVAKIAAGIVTGALVEV